MKIRNPHSHPHSTDLEIQKPHSTDAVFAQLRHIPSYDNSSEHEMSASACTRSMPGYL